MEKANQEIYKIFIKYLFLFKILAYKKSNNKDKCRLYEIPFIQLYDKKIGINLFYKLLLEITTDLKISDKLVIVDDNQEEYNVTKFISDKKYNDLKNKVLPDFLEGGIKFLQDFSDSKEKFILVLKQLEDEFKKLYITDLEKINNNFFGEFYNFYKIYGSKFTINKELIKGISNFDLLIHIILLSSQEFITINSIGYRGIFHQINITLESSYEAKIRKQIMIGSKDLYFDDTTGNLYKYGEKIGNIKKGNKPYLFFKYLYDNRGKQLLHNDIIEGIEGYNPSKTDSSYLSSIKKSLSLEFKNIIKSGKGIYYIP